MINQLSVVMMGATGAVGGQVVASLLAMPSLTRLTLLGRRPLEQAASAVVEQHVIDIFEATSYQHLLVGHECAVCTLGVSQPSKMSQSEFVQTDRDAVIAFATACKKAGIRHFQLLGSAAADSGSRYFYLRTKGELCDALVALNFPRLSIFQPSMILTPSNRFGLSQALTLALWPLLSPALVGSWRKYRGIRVETLGLAMARNAFTPGQGVEVLHWDQFIALAGSPKREIV